jgi:excinuclease ABC subunit A
MANVIRVRGARQHNLKGVDLDLPHRALTVVTGPSGSGKSTLAFDTIYAEGQRRYVESLSTYAKQFLERMPKPAVDRIEGVSPAVSIDQRNTVKSSRSTVGTVTEVYDYLRLLWARVGRTVCPECQRHVVPDTVQTAADRVLAWDEGTRIYVAFPFRFSAEITHTLAVSNLQAQGYLRVLADGAELYLPDLAEEGAADADMAAPNAEGATEDESRGGTRLDLPKTRDLLVVVDRTRVEPEDRERLTDSLAAAFAEGGGHAVVLRLPEGESDPRVAERYAFTEAFRCTECGRDFPEPRPVLFSFNSPAGACPECTGFGATLEYAPELIVPDASRSLTEGAIDPWGKPRYRRERATLRRFADDAGIDMDAPWRDLPERARAQLLEGGDGFRGAIPFLRSKERKRYKPYIRMFLRQYQLPRPCSRCSGTRLKPEALNVRVGELTIAAAAGLEISALLAWLQEVELTTFERKVAKTIHREIADRLQFLDDVGLGYLTLDRQARSLSGGEMQRIRLASCLGSQLVDTLYVLDEPTIGLHAYDIERFVSVLERLGGRGNTVLVVEHEPAVLERADRIVELGPGAGERGGEVVFEGCWPELVRADTSTGRALAERAHSRFEAPSGSRRQVGEDGWLQLNGARLHNLRGVDVDLPLGALIVVSGVSGSGKSTLIRHVLYHGLERALGGRASAKAHLGEAEGTYERLEGTSAVEAVVLVDQQPIGRTSRSNPATYIRAFGEIRRVFAAQREARKRGYGPGYFSFNRAGGRCEVCKGAGEEIVEMVFLADVAVPCEACGGARFRDDVLEIEYRGRNIRDVLDLTVDEAIRFFIRQDRLGETLWQLQRVGLGYLRLGQPATTLSGGEAQRLKIARELARPRRAGRRVYILDEPTVGLGVGEVATLCSVLRQLVAEHHTVIVIEHNLDVIAGADWIVDLGPGAAEEGGLVVAAGPPSRIRAASESRTGAYLRRHPSTAAPEADAPSASR